METPSVKETSRNTSISLKSSGRSERSPRKRTCPAIPSSPARACSRAPWLPCPAITSTVSGKLSRTLLNPRSIIGMFLISSSRLAVPMIRLFSPMPSERLFSRSSNRGLSEA